MSSPEIVGALEVLDEQRRGVRVVFCDSEDRVEHKISTVHGKQSVPVLESIEGNGGQGLPHVPCFQEIYRQGETLFLTGASSIGHWSMSVQVAEARFLSFDVACRLKESVRQVGSEYRLAESLELRNDEGASTVLLVDANEKVPGVQLLGTEPFSSSISHVDRSNLRLFSSSESPEKLPATVQWRYGVCSVAT